MAQNTRTELKNKFKRGMYPTEGDFANVFDSYVHKDDMVELEKVVQTIGNEQKTLATIINETKQEAIAAAVQQVGESEALTGIQNRLTTAEDDLDTAEDNIAGHETRIQTLETSNSDYEAFKERVRAFLEDADATDATINHWHEIETFLQGITDTQTLTGLLQNLKAEILAEIPEPEPQSGNYLKQISDLDGYTEAQDGEIVQYVGQTNKQYTRGFMYERIVSETKTYAAGVKILTFNNTNIVDNIILNGTYYEDAALKTTYRSPYEYYAKCKYQLKNNGDDTYTKEECTKNIYFYKKAPGQTEALSYVIIDGVYHQLPAQLQLAGLAYTGVLYNGDSYVYVPTAELWINIEDVTTQNSSSYYKAFQNAEGDIILYDPRGSAWNDWNVGLLITKEGVKIFLNPDNAGSLSESLFTDKFSELAEDVTIGGNYWQQLHTDNVIS